MAKQRYESKIGPDGEITKVLKMSKTTKKATTRKADAGERAERATKAASKKTASKKKVTKKTGTKKTPVKKADGQSKMDRATKIFKDMQKKDAPRKDVIAKFMDEVGLTKAGSSTYYQLIKKRIEDEA